MSNASLDVNPSRVLIEPSIFDPGTLTKASGKFQIDAVIQVLDSLNLIGRIMNGRSNYLEETQSRILAHSIQPLAAHVCTTSRLCYI